MRNLLSTLLYNITIYISLLLKKCLHPARIGTLFSFLVLPFQLLIGYSITPLNNKKKQIRNNC